MIIDQLWHSLFTIFEWISEYCIIWHIRVGDFGPYDSLIVAMHRNPTYPIFTITDMFSETLYLIILYILSGIGCAWYYSINKPNKAVHITFVVSFLVLDII